MNPITDDPMHAQRLAAGQAALQSSAAGRGAELHIELLKQLTEKLRTDTVTRFQDMFGPPRELWPAKTRLQAKLEAFCDRVLLVWDAICGRIDDFDGLEGVQLRDTNLDRFFGRKPSLNPAYEEWRAKQGSFETSGEAMRREAQADHNFLSGSQWPVHRGETVNVHRPQYFGLRFHRHAFDFSLQDEPAAHDEHRWADDGGAIA